MNDAAAHRGPDDEGLVLFGKDQYLEIDRTNSSYSDLPGDDHYHAGLGHKRLSIIDLSSKGHQPMHDPTNRYWIVLNGEIYNYLEIKEEIEECGVYDFKSQTDTEVALAAYILWGAEALKRFNGMWALAIYDRLRDKLFLSRDRFGVKPLHYACINGMFAFASEIKQLLELDNVSRTANYQTLADFFFWGFERHTNETFIEGIKVVPPSSFVEIGREEIEQGTILFKRYWELNAAPRENPTQAIDSFKELLTDSIRLRLRSDVPVGVTLSGGLDSSSVTCLAAQEFGNQKFSGKLSAFTAIYPDAGYSEQPFAQQVTNRCGATPIYITPDSSDLVGDWKRFIWNMEGPFSGLSYYSNWKIYQAIREHGIPVVLSGQGGDELLLGYDRYRISNLYFLWRKRKIWDFLSEVGQTGRHASMGVAKQAAYFMYFKFPILRAARRRMLVKPFMNKCFYQEHNIQTQHLVVESTNEDRADLQQKEFFHYQLQHLLHHEDRISMNFAIETRLPFLDYRLVEFVMGQDDGLLIQNGWSKYLLRQAMKGILPEAVRMRTDKMGFSTPTKRLFSDNKTSFLVLLNSHLDDPILDVESIAHEFTANRIEEGFLTSVISYLTWKEIFNIKS